MAAAGVFRLARTFLPEESISAADACSDWIDTLGLVAAASAARQVGLGRVSLALTGAAVLRLTQAAQVRIGRPNPPPPNLTVYSANLLFRNSQTGALLRDIRQARPDVVCLQELTPRTQDALVRSLGTRFPHRYLVADSDAYGFGILSRWPLTPGAVQTLAPGHAFLQSALVSVPGQEPRQIAVFNVHLVSPADLDLARLLSPAGVAELRSRQADVVVREVTAHGGTAIVAGDLNASPHQDPPRRIGAVARDAWADAGSGYGATWPRRFHRVGLNAPPLLRLDYVFLTDDLAATRARVRHRATGSDHSGLVVNARWLRQVG